MSRASHRTKADARRTTHPSAEAAVDDAEPRIIEVLDALEEGRGARDAVVVPIPSQSTTAVPEVRSTVSDVLDTALPPDMQREVQLICSELVTNALAHGAPPVRLVLHETPTDVIVAVFDRSAEPPAPSDSATSGLRIVESLSDHRWGVLMRDGGKWVWAAITRSTHRAGDARDV